MESKYHKYLSFFKSKEKKESFKLMDGEGSVMISTPHSVEQLRNGKIKYAEYETGVLACILHEELNCPVICKTFNYADDANFDEVSDYKEALKKYIVDHDIKYLIDLHQLSPARIENIDIGTGHGRNTFGDDSISEQISQAFNDAGFDYVFVDKIFSASYPYTISSYIARECGIPCIQIEINSKLVVQGYNEFCFDRIENVLKEAVIYLQEKSKNERPINRK